MSFLNPTTQMKLEEAFVKQNMSLEIHENYVVAKNSGNQQESRIRQIIEQKGFCPLISKNKINGNFVFTIAPYQMPSFFNSPSTGQMIEFPIGNEKEKCETIAKVLEKEVPSIQSWGVYSAVPRNSTEFEQKAAHSSAAVDGTFRYAHAFTNKDPITIKWLISDKIAIFAVPKQLVEQHSRALYKSYDTVPESFWFCSKDDYFITLRPGSNKDLETGFWKGSIEQRKEYFKKEFIEKDLFGSWIDHWDCIKGGMKQPVRINPITRRSNFSHENGPVMTISDLFDKNILGKNPEILSGKVKIFG